MDCLLTVDINQIDWDKTSEFITLVLLIIQIVISSFLTWKIIKQSQQNISIINSQNEISTKIQLFDRRIEVLQAGQYIINIITVNIFRFQENIEVDVCFPYIQDSIRTNLFIKNDKNYVFNNDFFNKQEIIENADLFFSKELVIPIKEIYQQLLQFIMFFYHYTDYSELDEKWKNIYSEDINRIIEKYIIVKKCIIEMRKELVVQKKIT